MTAPKDRKPLGRRLPESSTLKDTNLTAILASRVRREVAVEKAVEGVEAGEEAPEERVVVVLGPDGVPQIADEPGTAPETVRVDLDEPPVTRKAPLPPKKR